MKFENKIKNYRPKNPLKIKNLICKNIFSRGSKLL